MDRTYLGIAGLELSPALGQMMLSGFWEGSLSQTQIDAMEAALSYVANVVTLCALYLDVPLRYPIRLLGSRSIITTPLSSRLLSLGYERSNTRQEYPLFFQGSGRSSKKKLSVAFSFLAKDILQLLSSYGINPVDGSCVLANLDALIAASRSGISTRTYF